MNCQKCGKTMIEKCHWDTKNIGGTQTEEKFHIFTCSCGYEERRDCNCATREKKDRPPRRVSVEVQGGASKDAIVNINMGTIWTTRRN